MTRSRLTRLIKAVTVGAGLAVPQAHAQKRKSDREHAELIGPVRTVSYETAKLEEKGSKLQEGKRRVSRTLAYDEIGRLTEMAFRSPLDGSMIKSGFDDDEQGTRIQTQGSNAPLLITKYGTLKSTGGTLRTKIEYKFDSNGNRTEEIAYLADGSKITTAYVYDENARIASKLSTGEGKASLTVFKRDQQGAIIDQTVYKTGGLVESNESYTYEFDARHNWIKRIASRTVTKRGQTRVEPFEATYRTITYY